MSHVPSLTLNNGVEIPQLGFGVWQIPAEDVVGPVTTAIETGYRLIDTAAIYGNEEGVGKAIAESGVARDELFVTTKVWNSDQGYDSTMRAFDASLNRLGLEYVDLYLIHWPVPARDRYVDTWRALEKVAADGRSRAIGVSNFKRAHLQRLFDETDVVPAVNQIELHPRLPQEDMRAFHEEHGIVTQAWSPIGQGQGLLDDPVIGELASAHGRTPAQVVIRWHLQLGNNVFPKSANVQRIRENFDVFGFELGDDDMRKLATLASGERLGPDPDDFNAA
ncbi:MAG: aldo/keto reductase [Actinomycetota bacterium]|nr:aldo/keto reductase [Actinomycetota bacterium]